MSATTPRGTVDAPQPGTPSVRTLPHVRVSRASRLSPQLAVIGLLVVAGLALMPAVAAPSILSKLVDAFILLALSCMWNLLAGYAGLVSVGQQTFIGLGSYTVLILAQWGLQPYLALPLAAIACAVLALPASWLLFRLRGGYFAIATWVVADAVQLAISHFPSLGGGTGANLPPIPGLEPLTRLQWTYWSALAIAVLAVAATYLLLRGRIGLTLTALRDDEIGARSVGVRVGAAKRIVYVLAAAGCGAAGGLLILSELNVLATNVFSVGWSAKMIFITIIGGVGSIEGPIIGTIVYVLLQEGLASYGAWYFIVVGAVAIGVALWTPRGLWGAIAARTSLRPFPVGYRLWVDDLRPAATGTPAPDAALDGP